MTENAMEGRFRLDLGGGETDTLPIGFADRRDEERLAELLGTGEQLRVRLTPAMDTDTEGHVLRRGELDTLVRLQAVEGDDTEGHAISLRFPSAEEANRFRTRMLATGALVGTLVVGSVAMQALPSNLSQGIAQPGTAPAAAAAAQAATTMVEGGRRDAGAAAAVGAASAATGADAAIAMVQGGRRDAGAAAATGATGADAANAMVQGGRRDAGAAAAAEAVTAADAATTMVNSGRRDAAGAAGTSSQGSASDDDESIDRSGRTGPKIR